MQSKGNEVIFLLEETTGGGYQARALGHSIFTCADDITEFKTMIKDAVRCHIDDEDMPGIIRLHQVRDEVMAL
jgi:hypothetical protein